MLSSVRGRLGAAATAIAVIGTGLFVATPANAAEAEITVANTTFTEGDWGTGLKVAGAGFDPDSSVAVFVSYDQVSSPTYADSIHVAMEEVEITPDGSFNTTLLPSGELVLPAVGQELNVAAISSDGTLTAPVTLTVLRTAGIETDVSTISAADLADREAGVSVIASGFAPDETVTIEVTSNGATVPILDTLTADRSGTVFGTLWVVGDTAGTLTITLTGAGGHVETTTVTVTGDTTTTGGGNPPSAVIEDAPAAATTAAKLPVVSG